MGVTIQSYPITPTTLGAGVYGLFKHIPNLGMYAEYVVNGSTYGFRMWSDRTLTKLDEWTSTSSSLFILGGAGYENWCFGAVSGKLFFLPSGAIIKIKRLTPVTLAEELSFGATGSTVNDIDSFKTSYGLAPAVDVFGTGHLCSLALSGGCYIWTEELVPVACSNVIPNADTPAATLDFYGYPPDLSTGRAQWWLSLYDSASQFVSANIISYVPGVINEAGGENIIVTEIHRLNEADYDTYFQTNVGSDIRYIPCPDVGILLVCATSTTGTHVVAVNLSDTSQVLWRSSYANCDILGSNDLTTTDYSNRPITRGRYMALGEIVDDGAYNPETVYLIDIQSGAVLDSGSVASIAVGTSSPQRSFWNASTGDLILVTGGGASEGIHRVRFDYDLSAGLGYGQDFDAPTNLIEGFRGTRLERSNVTGVINTFFEDLEDRLQSYVDAAGESYVQQALDMNNYKITNVPYAVAPDDLIPKAQAEALA